MESGLDNVEVFRAVPAREEDADAVQSELHEKLAHAPGERGLPRTGKDM